MSIRPSLLKSYIVPLRLLNRRPRTIPDTDPRWKSRPSTSPTNAVGTLRLRYLTRFVPLRKLRVILAIVVSVALILLLYPSQRAQSHTADAKHLNQFVNKVRAKLAPLDTRDDTQEPLSPSPESSESAERTHRTFRWKGGIIGDIFLDQDEEDDWNYFEDDEDQQLEADVEGDLQDWEDIQAEEDDDKDDEGFEASKPYHGQYRQLFSLTTENREFFRIHFGGPEGYNPNIIPHPSQHDLWIVAAQHREKTEQISCSAGFLDGTLTCTNPPLTLNTAPSVKGSCSGEFDHFNMEPGARDGRMFYGPQSPYILYGSQSRWTCLGVWLQDLRMLIDAYAVERHVLVDLFKSPTEIRRPPPWRDIEKNFFLFWDDNGKQYIHHELWPKRVFTLMDFDGSVGEDLAPLAGREDTVCMAKYMPHVRSKYETLEQATNSLMITTCKRKDPGCIPSNQNTYIATIMHHKSFYDFHAVFEPYLVLFNQSTPFNLFGISQRPFWIHGRKSLTEESFSKYYEGDKAKNIPEGHSETFYMTSMSWKTHGQRYHGYVDDPLLLSFGMEDTRSGAIDVLPADLLQDIATC